MQELMRLQNLICFYGPNLLNVATAQSTDFRFFGAQVISSLVCALFARNSSTVCVLSFFEIERVANFAKPEFAALAILKLG